jgi:hypothetical protein
VRRPQQLGRRCDPARFIPTPCRRHVAPANDALCAHRRAGVVPCADPCRHRRKRLPALPDIGRDRQEMLSRCASNQAPSTSRPSTPAQPKHQIAISRALHTAGSFLGDFPTPEGVRNSSRERNGAFRPTERRSGHSTARVKARAEDPRPAGLLQSLAIARHARMSDDPASKSWTGRAGRVRSIPSLPVSTRANPTMTIRTDAWALWRELPSNDNARQARVTLGIRFPKTKSDNAPATAKSFLQCGPRSYRPARKSFPSDCRPAVWEIALLRMRRARGTRAALR